MKSLFFILCIVFAVCVHAEGTDNSGPHDISEQVEYVRAIVSIDQGSKICQLNHNDYAVHAGGLAVAEFVRFENLEECSSVISRQIQHLANSSDGGSGLPLTIVNSSDGGSGVQILEANSSDGGSGAPVYRGSRQDVNSNLRVFFIISKGSEVSL